MDLNPVGIPERLNAKFGKSWTRRYQVIGGHKLISRT